MTTLGLKMALLTSQRLAVREQAETSYSILPRYVRYLKRSPKSGQTPKIPYGLTSVGKGSVWFNQVDEKGLPAGGLNRRGSTVLPKECQKEEPKQNFKLGQHHDEEHKRVYYNRNSFLGNLGGKLGWTLFPDYDSLTSRSYWIFKRRKPLIELTVNKDELGLHKAVCTLAPSYHCPRSKADRDDLEYELRNTFENLKWNCI